MCGRCLLRLLVYGIGVYLTIRNGQCTVSKTAQFYTPVMYEDSCFTSLPTIGGANHFHFSHSNGYKVVKKIRLVAILVGEGEVVFGSGRKGRFWEGWFTS